MIYFGQNKVRGFPSYFGRPLYQQRGFSRFLEISFQFIERYISLLVQVGCGLSIVGWECVGSDCDGDFKFFYLGFSREKSLGTMAYLEISYPFPLHAFAILRYTTWRSCDPYAN